MTEPIPSFSSLDLDPEDVALSEVIRYLQLMVEDRLRQTGISINDMTEDQQQSLIDKIDPYIAFEVQQSSDFFIGMPIEAEGKGGFLVIDTEAALLGAEQTEPKDKITGTVCKVHAYPVPSKFLMAQPADIEGVPLYDQSLSIHIVLSDARFYSKLSNDGIYQVEQDLSQFLIGIPVVYDMDIRMANINTG